MDNWTRELEKWLEPIAREVEATVETVTTQVDQWLEQSAQDFEQAATELQTQVETHLAETWGIEVDRLRREMEEAIGQTIEEWMADWFSPFWDEDWPNVGTPPTDENASPSLNQYDALYDQLNPKVPPSPDRHAACIGCRHYHGRVYNDQLLVCGMHPFGWEEGGCPDWEATPSPPNEN